MQEHQGRFFYFVNMLKGGVIIFNILLINLNKIGEGEDFCKYLNKRILGNLIS